MRPEPGKPYYTAYDKRYRAVYAQGVAHWTANPKELAAVEGEVRGFLSEANVQPGARVIEFGCGEGFVGALVAGMGCFYTGVDIAESAVEKARARLAQFGDRVQLHVADILNLSAFPSASFDAGLDVSSLHMLVVDADRQRYLREAHRLLKPGAPMLFCRESCRSDAPTEVVESYEQWLRLSRTDVDTPESREAWQDGHSVTVRLPRIASRARSLEQYRAEIESAGFLFGDCLGNSRNGFLSFLCVRGKADVERGS
jgi:ubiquinone/menaquinone biosynthesis C-methylase UbiE